MQRVTRIMAPRRMLLLLIGGVGAVVLAASFAWACSSSANMTLSNVDNAAWNDGNKGENFSYCPNERGLNHNLGTTPDCTRDVDVHGTGFTNHDGTSINEVELYWLDGAAFLGGIGFPADPGQQTSGQVCRELGVKVKSGVSVNSGEFSTTVKNLPPTDETYEGGAERPVKAHYTANAICAVWSHDHAGDLDYSGLGNQYNIWPRPPF